MAKGAARATFENKKIDEVAVLRDLLPYIWPADRRDLRIRVALAFVSLIIAKVITVATPIAYKGAVDLLTGQGGDPAVVVSTTALLATPVMLILAYGLGRIMMIIFNQIRDVLFVNAGQHAVRSLSNRAFSHTHKLSLRYHLERQTGGHARAIERGVDAVELIIRMGLLNSIPTLVEFGLIAVVLSWYIGWEFVVVVALTILIYIWFTIRASEWRVSIIRELTKADNEAGTKAVDSLLNYETVKYFGNEKLEQNRYDQSREQYEAAAIKTHYSLGMLNAGQALIFTAGLTICMLIAGSRVAAGQFTIGDFVMINALLIQLYQPLHLMGTIYRAIRQSLVDLENLFGILNTKPEIIDVPGTKALKVDTGHIRFEGVDFAYEVERPIIKDVSFDVPAGQMVAIVGPSGAGKSTISRLLFRFYEPLGGAIKVDGQDIAEVTQASLRKAIGVVPQDTVLFNDTIYYNIAYGNPDASRDEIIAAAKMAHIHEFILDLPKGYDSLVGERGLKLSGGEKQRVAIARTILKAPPILMLDEATSALDSYTEKEIQAALDEVAHNRTTLVIAHRLSTIIHADNIIVLEKGRIAEQGNHGELLKKEGLYAGLWARQREADEARQKLAYVLEEE
ncbi:MAG: ABC transporter ATP-binding protein/permease [bacterium]|nr:ABC transporter ATP-binding protein/permease [bacterium]